MTDMDWSNYQEVKAGEKASTKVAEVKQGKQEEFRTEKYFDNIEGSREEIDKIKASSAILVKCENGAEMVINLPASKVISPKSKLGMWKRTYNAFPTVGQEVTTKVDENGFQRIVLESM